LFALARIIDYNVYEGESLKAVEFLSQLAHRGLELLSTNGVFIIHFYFKLRIIFLASTFLPVLKLVIALNIDLPQ